MACEIEVHNFKSYGGSEVLPLGRFTAIVGPDSPGKADLIDAISFVLGVQTDRFSDGDLRNLIYAEASTASVKLKWLCPSMLFSRSITDGGECTWMVDENHVSRQVYAHKLRSIGIIDNARKFIVLRGDLESVVSRNSNKLSMFFEQAIGSAEDRRLYQEANKRKAQADANFMLASKKRGIISVQVEQKNWEVEGASKCILLKNELKSELQNYYRQKISLLKGQLATATQDEGDAHAQHDEARRRMTTCIEVSTKIIKERDKLIDDMFKLKEEISLKKHALFDKQLEITKLEKEKVRLENTNKMLTNSEKEESTRKTDIAQIRDELKNLMTSHVNLQIKDHSEDLQGTYIDSFFPDSEVVKDLEGNIQQLLTRTLELESQQKEMQNKKATIILNLEKYNQELTDARKMESDVSKLLETSMQENTKLRKSIEDINDQLSNLKAENYECQRDWYMNTVEDALKGKYHGCMSRLSKWGDVDKLSVTVASGRFMNVQADHEQIVQGRIQRWQCLSSDRISLTKAGTFIDVTSGQMKMMPQGYADKQIEVLKEQRKEHESGLQNLQKLREMRIKISEASRKIDGIIVKINRAETEKKATEDRILSIDGELINIKNKCSHMEGQHAKLITSISSRHGMVSSVEVKNIHRVHLEADDQKIYVQRLDLIKQISRLKHRHSYLEFEEKYGLGTHSAKLKSSCLELQKSLVNFKELEASIQEASKEIQVYERKVDGMETSILESHERIKANESMMPALKTNAKLLGKELAHKMGIIDKLDLKETTLGDIQNIEDFFLPSESTDIEADDGESRRIKEYHEGHMRSIRSSFRKTYPNNNDTTQLAALIGRKNVLHTEFVKADGLKKKADKEYARARSTRLEHFNKAFKHLSRVIDKNYRRLMGSTATCADVYVCHDDEPDLHGMKYVTMSTNKKHGWEIDQLSVGEMTVAALAFIFSIRSFEPSPLFILDEVDTVLDDSSAARVASYIRTYSHVNNCQSIVISRKRNFYDKADVVIAVSHKPDVGRSKAHKLDLTRCKEVSRTSSDRVVVLDDCEMEPPPVLPEKDALLQLHRFLNFPDPKASCYISLLENDIPCNKEWWRDLLNGGWLDSQHIDAWAMYLLLKRPVGERWGIMPTSFLEWFHRGGDRLPGLAIGRDKPYPAWAGLDHVFFPISVGDNHWIVMKLDLNTWVVTIYNSYTGIPISRFCGSMMNRLKEHLPEFLRTIGFWQDRSEPHEIPLTDKVASGVPQQDRGSGDCGVFACMFIEKMTKSLSLDLEGTPMQAAANYRRKMAEILFSYKYYYAHTRA